MRIYKNRTSGRYFISIDEDIEEIEEEFNLLLITPEGKVKRLERHLFEALDSDERDVKKLLLNRKLTAAQRNKYKEVLHHAQQVN
jgi:hypothetical protein